jgi:hypothetical protein
MECQRANAWIRGCKFEPRFDSEPSNAAGFSSLRGMTADEISLLLTKRVYVRDVCATCGKTVERK